MKLSIDSSKRVGSWRQHLDLVAVFALAFLIRFANFRHEPLTDELYHLLAAASWLSSGEFLIAAGEYLRGTVFTMIVGSVLAVSGGSLDAVRLLCVLLGALLVLAVFVAVRALAGRAEAWTAAVMLAMMPGAVFLSQYIRFYGLHALVFWVAAVMIYVIAQGDMTARRRAGWLLPLALLIGFGFHLQITTAIGLVGIALWFVVINLPRLWALYQAGSRGGRLVMVAGAILVPVVGLGLLFGPLDFLIRYYRGAPLWSAGQNPLYYLYLYNEQFGAFWALFPVAAVAALAVRPKPAVFFLCVFITALVLQSFGGLQAERFNFYAMPFFVATWGLGGVVIVRWLHGHLTRAIVDWGVPDRGIVKPARLSRTLLTLAVAFAVLSTPATELTAKMVAGMPVRESGGELQYWSKYRGTWSKAVPTLEELLGQERVLVTSQGLHALYFLGDYDFELNATRLSDFAPLEGIWLDPRTGRPVLASHEALDRVRACHRRGLLVVHDLGWRSRAIVNEPTADWIEANFVRVDMPSGWGLVGFTWDNGGEGRPALCRGM